MPPSQTQTRLRFANLYPDPKYDPTGGDNTIAQILFDANGANPTEPSSIKNKLTAVTLQGKGLTSILLLARGDLRRIFLPFVHHSVFGVTNSQYEDHLLGIDGELMGSTAPIYSVVELPPDLFRKTAAILTLKPDPMSALYAGDRSATTVGPFSEAQAGDADKEKIKTRYGVFVPHEVGDLMSPAAGMTPRYFWTVVYPWIVSEGKTAEYDHLIKYFQVVSTLEVAGGGGASAVDKPRPVTIQRDESVYEAIESILTRLFPSTASNPGHGSEIAKELGNIVAVQQRQSEEAEERSRKAEERRLLKEEEKYSLEKQLGKQALIRLQKYNGCTTVEELKLRQIPLVEALAECKSTNDNDILEAFQEAVDKVADDLEIEDEDRLIVEPQMLKEFLKPWERLDPDSLITGFGSNLFLHGPRDRVKSAEQVELFKTTHFATNAPDSDKLKRLYSGEVYVPTILDVGWTLRSMLRIMMAVLRPAHPHLESLKKVISKWTDLERRFNEAAIGDNEPARGIYLLEALNMLMNEYWREQKKSRDLLPGWDGNSVFKLIRGKKHWEPNLSPRYRSQLKLDLFVGVFGGHRILSEGDRATVQIVPQKTDSTASVAGLGNVVGPGNANGEDGGQLQDTQVKNTRYLTQGTRLFGRFKRRKDPDTNKEYPIKKVREKEADKPIPKSKTGKGGMCLAFHCKGMCNIRCPRSYDHIFYEDEEYKPLIQWCEECYPGSDE